VEEPSVEEDVLVVVMEGIEVLDVEGVVAEDVEGETDHQAGEALPMQKRSGYQ